MPASLRPVISLTGLADKTIGIGSYYLGDW